MAKSILNWPKGVKVFVKVILMVFCLLALSALPLVIQDSVTRSISLNSEASVSASEVANTFFYTMFFWFAGFLVLMFLVNLIFFLVDESKNDLVRWRRSLQVFLNICIIISGVIAGFVLLQSYFPAQQWWDYLLLRSSFTRNLNRVPYIAFIVCSIFQFFWDVWLFGPENRSPIIAKLLQRSARKQALKKENRA
jgi:hypothetical protein